MDWDDFVQRARKLAPHDTAKPYLVGILDYQKSVHDELKNTDFFWLGCNEDTLAQRVREQYQKRIDVSCIRLYFKDTLVGDSDPVKNFAKLDNDFIMFAAADPVQTEARLSTSALQVRARPYTQEAQQQGHNHSASPPTKLRNSAGGNASEVKPDGVKEDMLPSPGEVSLLPNDRTLNTITTFDPSSIFRLPPAKDGKENLTPLDRQIGRVIDLQDADILEAGVARSIQILENLKHTFSHHFTLGANADVATWTKAIDKLVLQTKPNRTIIGVVGNTGAGKSSVINAILDEERLVPTSCMRACTAVVTEISWNSNPSGSKYRAEIDFISPKDWENELSVLMQELLSGNGTLSHEAQDPNSEAGVAWAKFRAVYPSVAKSELQEGIIPTLMSETSVSSVLGTTKQIYMDRAEDFYIALLRYIDSKEKVPEKDKNKSADKVKGNASEPSPEMEYWPLIKVVKIYTTSSALSTGAVLVDLPGVHDSNAARAAVAQGYMKQCTGLWIVAPINRAVDDKAAKTLLGNSFKRQLKYDGGFANVTFICSKTDDISIMEAIGSLRLEDEVGKLDEQQRSCDEQIENTMREISQLKELRNVRKAIITNASNDIETWEALQEQLEEGKRVYAPVTRPNKRKKASTNNERAKKRQAIEDDSDGEFFRTSRQSYSSEGEVELETEQVQLCESDIKKKLKELKDTRKRAQRECNEAQDAISLLKGRIRKLETEKSRIKAKVSRICISGRNLYSKSAIQRDFASGIREMDQENATEADEESFDPEKELRNYEQIAQSLPVFCVSSRAYQKMCGHLQKDDDVPGFATPEDTEIPQLQDHCRKLTEAGRIQTSRTFLAGFCQLLIDLRLWTLDKNSTLKMTDNDSQQELGSLKPFVKKLRSDFDEIVNTCIEEVRSEMKSSISDKLSELINAAIEAAPEIAYSWGQKEKGGLVWASYRAVVRHNGVFRSPTAGHRDFNSELVDPIMKPLTPIWENTFHTYLPEAIDKHIHRLSKQPRYFHEAVESRAQMIGIGRTILSILSAKALNYKRIFKSFGIFLTAQMNELQREASRDFAPCIADAMRTGYNTCAAVRGTGSFKQMKERMTDHVELARRTMFHKLAQQVDKRLNYMCEKLQELIDAKITDICDQMSADYMVSSGGNACNQLMRQQSKENHKLVSAVYQILESVDTQFEAIANGDIGSVNEAKQIGVKVEEPRDDGESKHGDISGTFQESLEEANHGNDDSNSLRLDYLSSSRHGRTSRFESYVQDNMSDNE